jgi:hypothetical protein
LKEEQTSWGHICCHQFLHSCKILKNQERIQLHRETEEELWNCSLGGWLLKPSKIHSKQTKNAKQQNLPSKHDHFIFKLLGFACFLKTHIENWIRSMLRAKFLTLLQCLLAFSSSSSSSILFVVTDGT